MAKKRLQKKKAAAKAEAERIKTASGSVQHSNAKLETKKTEVEKIATSKTEPVKVETKKTEPVKVSTSKTEPVKVETKKTEPVKVSTSKTEPIKVETKNTEPVKVETKKTEPVKIPAVEKDTAVYQERLNRHMDELKWLYCELYQDDPQVMEHLTQLLDGLKGFYDARNADLKASDLSREKDPRWYKRNDLT